jgi:hypothetical protein
LKAWEKLEEKLNLLIGGLLNFLKAFVSKTTPTSIKKSLDDRKKKNNIDFRQVQAKLLGIKSKIHSFTGKITMILAKAINFFKGIESKDLKLKQLFLVIAAILSPLLGRLRDWYIALKPTTMLAMVSMTTVGGLSSIVIYKEVQKITEKSRDPASEIIAEVDSTNIKRPDYYKKQERELRVRNVSIPIYTGGRTPASGKKVIIDFTFVSSNRYIKEFFFENSHLLKDKLNTSIEQILPDFPLEDDGKRVIKEKIKKEMQVLLDDLKIKGSIQEIYIHSIMAG